MTSWPALRRKQAAAWSLPSAFTDAGRCPEGSAYTLSRHLLSCQYGLSWTAMIPSDT